MSDTPVSETPPAPPVASPEQTLRRLFLTVFLRGRSSRGLHKATAPKSIASKLTWVLLGYAFMGLFTLSLLRQPVFALGLYLHATAFLVLGTFVAASSGELLFHKEEADILLHRPVTPRALLWAKVAVLTQVSLWMACAYNFAGCFVGLGAVDGHWWFPLAHLLSTALQALFCIGAVVVIYQLCLRWFGRERLDGLMTMAQVFVAIGAMLGAQIVPRVAMQLGPEFGATAKVWWICLLPPAWFAGIDDALAGSGGGLAWLLAGLGVLATVSLLWLAFGKLARDYGSGLKAMHEVVAATPGRRGGRRWLDRLVGVPPLRWWLRDPVARASFLLTAAYLMRDRDVKLRLYPSIAPILVLPALLLFQDVGRPGGQSGSGFGLAICGSYLGLIPLMGLSLLQYSQQWQASDLFRAVPLAGPAPLCHGARRAVLCLLTLPVLLGFLAIAWLVGSEPSQLLLLLPGTMALPVYALMPNLRGRAVPLSQPTEEAKAAGRNLGMFGVMFAAMVLALLTTLAQATEWFWWLVGVEAVIVVAVYAILRSAIDRAPWPSLD